MTETEVVIANEVTIVITYKIENEVVTVSAVTIKGEYKTKNELWIENGSRKRSGYKTKKRFRKRCRTHQRIKLMMLIEKFRRNLDEKEIRRALIHHISRDG
jgi:hypothetical protein